MSADTLTPVALPDTDALPTCGGSYSRQPDGSLVRNTTPDDPKPVATAPITDTPQE